MGGKESKQFPITTDEALKRGNKISLLKKWKNMKSLFQNVIHPEFFNCIFSD